MAFDFSKTSAKHESIARMVHSGIECYSREIMDNWLNNIVNNSKDANIISRYTFENNGVCLWISKNASIQTFDGVSYTVAINGLSFQTCPLPISGIKMDLDKELCKGKQITLLFKNNIYGPEKNWKEFHKKDWMMSDEWAGAFINDGQVDLSEFCEIHFKTTFTSYHALRQIAKKFSAKKILLGNCGILMQALSNRIVYVDIIHYLTLKIFNKNDLLKIGVELDFRI